MKRAVVWLIVLVLAGATALVGSSAHAQPAAGCGFARCSADANPTPSSSPSSVSSVPDPPSSVQPGTPPPTYYSAHFMPCTADGTQDGSEPCDQDPVTIQVVHPAHAPPDQVQVNWSADGRSAAAPNPETTSVTLTAAQGSECGTDLTCWPWPTALDDGSFVLNGTYQLVVCPYSSAPNGTCQSPLPPQSIGVAVAPGPPTAVSAHAAGREVTVSWSPPKQAPPDLVGYTVSRDNTTIYTCSSGSDTPCPSTLEMADHPGNGEYTYSVSALRLGVDSAPANYVSSPPATDGEGVVTVPGGTDPGGTTGQGGGPSPGPGQGGTQVNLDPGPNSPAPVPATYNAFAGGTQVTLGRVSAAAQTPAAVSPPVPKLSYPTAAGIAPTRPQALSLKVSSGTSHQDVVPVAVLALGILSLAVAAHFLYLRVELGVVQARLAARRAAGL